MNRLKFFWTLIFILLSVSNLIASRPCDESHSSLNDVLKTEFEFPSDPFGNRCNASCPGGYTDIHLFAKASSYHEGGVTNALLLTEFDYRIKSEDLLPKEIVTFDNARGLAAGILKLNDRCFRIKKLTIDSHGDDGYIHGNEDEGIDIYSLSDLDGISCAFSKDAEIDLSGCRVARGVMGEDFVRQIGKRLLWQRGGSVTAANNYTTTLPAPFGAFLPIFSIDGKWKKFIMGANGVEVGFTDKAIKLAEKVQIIASMIEKIMRILQETDKISARNAGNISISNLKTALSELETAEMAGGLEKIDDNKRLYIDKLIYSGLFYADRAIESE